MLPSIVVQSGCCDGFVVGGGAADTMSQGRFCEQVEMPVWLQLVGAGFGCTLVPALAVRGSWLTDTGIIARQLELPDAFRTVSLVFRSSFPRRPALEAFARIVKQHLPNTVRPLEA